MNRNLSIRTTKLQVFVLFLMAFVTNSYSQTNNYTGATGGSWSLGTNWSLGHAPLLAEDVTIPDNRNVTINVANASCNSLTILTGANNNTVTLGANTLTITGALTIQAPTGVNINKIFAITTGTLNCGNISLADTANANMDCRVTVTSGSINCLGNITMNGADTENQIQLNGTATLGATLNIGGNFVGGAGGVGDITSTNNNSIVNYNGSGVQTVAVNAFFVYNNLVLNNSNSVGISLQAAITAANLNRNITVQSGIFNNGGFAIAGNATRVFTVANGATFILSGTVSAFPSGFTTRTLGATSNVIYNGTGNQTIFDIPAPGYGNLEVTNATKTIATNGIDVQGNLLINPSTILAGTSFTNTITGNITNNGTVTLTTGRINVTGNFNNNGTFTGGTTSTVAVTGNLINSGVFTAGTGASNLNIFGNYTNNGTFTCGAAGTVTFTGTATGRTLSGTLTGASGAFFNLTFNGVGGGWTPTGNIAANGNLNLTNGTLNNGGFAITGVATKVFTIGAGGKLELDGTTSSFPSGFTTNTINVASTVEYKGTGSQTIFDIAAPGYGNLTVTNNSSKTFAGSSLDIQGTVTINPTATLVATAFTHNVSGSWINNGTFTAGTSTINFTSAVTGRTLSGTLSGATGAFFNLTFNSSTGGWTLANALAVNGNLTLTSGTLNNGGFSITGVATKTFSMGATGRLELAGTTSAFPSGFTTNTLNAASTVEYKGSGSQTVFDVAAPGYGNLILSNNATKTFAGSAIDVQGTVTINPTATLVATAFTHNVRGDWVNNGTFTAGTSTINFTSAVVGRTLSGTLSGATGAFNNIIFNSATGGWTLAANLGVNNAMTITSGTLNNGGFSITGLPTKVFSMGATGKLEVAGTTSAFPSGFTTNTLNATSTVEYKGTGNQLVFNVAGVGYGNLIINNAIKTAQGILSVKGNLSVQSGTFDNGGFAIVGAATKILTVSNGATLKLSGTTSAFPSTFTTNTIGASSTVDYSGTGIQTIFDVVSPGYGNLTISGNAIKTASGDLDIQGDVNVLVGTLDNGGFNLLGTVSKSLTIANGATLKLNGSSAYPTTFGTTNLGVSSTVDYAGAGIQTIFDVVTPGYGNLTISGNAIKTAAGDLDIQGDLNVQAGTLDNGGFNLLGTVSKSLTIANGATLKLNGSSAYPTAFGTNMLGATSTINYAGSSSQTIFDVATPGYGNLTISGNAIKTASSDLDIQGDLNVTTGTLDNGGFNLLGTASKALTIANGATLKLNGSSAYPTAFGTNILGATSTIDYAGSSSQSVFDVATPGYGNLTISGNAIKTTSGDIDIQGDLNVTAGTLDNGGFNLVGTVTKSLTIANGATLKLNGSSAYPNTFGTNILGATSTIDYAGSSSQSVFDVATPGYGNLTISGNATKTAAGDLDIQGDLNVTAGTLNNGGFNLLGTVSKSLTIANGATLKLNGSSAYPTAFGTNILGATSTIDYAGSSSQSVFDVATPGYGNLTISGNATKTAAGDLDIQGDLNVAAGTLDNGGFNLVGAVAKSFSLANGATLKLDGTSAYPTSFGTNTLGTNSTVDYSGAGIQTIFDLASPGYGNLTISGNANKTAAGDLDIQGDLNVAAGTLDNGGFNLVGSVAKSFSLANGATLKLDGTSAYPTSFGTITIGTTSTVDYSGAGIQTIFDVATPGYGNLTISGNATKTVAGDLDIRGDLNVLTGNLNNGGFNILGIGSNAFNLNDGATLQLEGTSSFPTSFNTTNLTTLSTVEYKGNGIQSFYDVPSPGYGNLKFNGVGGIWIASSDIDVANLVNVVNGTATMNTTLTIAGNGPLTVASTGNLIFNNGASLIQSGYTGVNSGNVLAKKNSAPIRSFDYTYWCAPTSGSQTLLNFSPSTLTDKFLTYHNAWTFINPTTTTFSPGIGYGVRAPQGLSTVPSAMLHQFTGVPNNGDINVPVTLATSGVSNRLIGNPYPSTLDADAFILANITGSGTINQTISGTLYFWTHNNTIVANNYASNDYATYNLLGGTAVPSGNGNTTAPTRYIASGQGFFVHTLATGNVSFRNNMRVGPNNTNFYRTSNGTTASRTSFESHRIWLNLTNSSSSFTQILIGYTPNATFGIDPGFDGLYTGADKQTLFSIIENKNFTIQARPLPFVDTDVIPLGYRNNIAGNMTITIDHVDGLFLEGQKVYLQDNLMNVIVCLSDGSYSFTSATGEFRTRFNIIFKSSLSRKDLNLENENLNTFNFEGQLHVVSNNSKIKNIYLYDLLGRLIEERLNIDSNNLLLDATRFKDQVLLLRTEFEDGLTSERKLKF